MTLSHTAAFPAARYPRFYLFVLALLATSFPLAVALRIALAISIPSFLSLSLPLPFPLPPGLACPYSAISPVESQLCVNVRIEVESTLISLACPCSATAGLIDALTGVKARL